MIEKKDPVKLTASPGKTCCEFASHIPPVGVGQPRLHADSMHHMQDGTIVHNAGQAIVLPPRTDGWKILLKAAITIRQFKIK